MISCGHDAALMPLVERAVNDKDKDVRRQACDSLSRYCENGPELGEQALVKLIAFAGKALTGS